jgi:tRNA(Ile)-lysidine synthetase-like protein
LSLSLCHNGVKSGRFNETVAEIQSRLLQGLAGELPGPGPLLIGVSGGGDSVALLRLLSAMAPGRDWHLWVAHVNHGLRPEAGAEAEFVRGLARDLGHEFLLHRAGGLKPGLSMEESCRRTRHNWLAGQAAKVGARATVLGHTLDDQAETLLCRALSGSGPTGLAGMRPYQDGLWRPLLNTRRDDLRGYLKALGQNWQSDPSNLDLGPLRNRVRHRILPLAKDLVNNKADEALARLAGILQSEEDYWDERVRALWAAHGSRQGISCFVQNEAQNLHRAELGRLMRWIAGRMLDRGQHLLSMHLEQLWELWAGEPGRKLTLPLGLCAYREHLGLRLEVNPLYKNLALWLVISVLMVLLFQMFHKGDTSSAQLPYSELVEAVESGPGAQRSHPGPGDPGRIQRPLRQLGAGSGFRTFTPEDPELMPLLRKHKVRIIVKPAEESPWVSPCWSPGCPCCCY